MISVFTPFHKTDTTFLIDAYTSLKAQTFLDWEWVILLNGDGLNANISFLETDIRVKIYRTDTIQNIGKLKHQACSYCIGDVFLEFDFDDLLTDNCLEEVSRAFQDENTRMVYSNCAEFEDETWTPNFYSHNYGWVNRPFEYRGRNFIESVSWPPSAQMMRRVEWAPNHVRAWSKSSYFEIGGHNLDLSTGDDHELCCRYYLKYGEKGFKHIDKCLYLYRTHPSNTVKLKNSNIQHQTDQNYLNYSRSMAMRWAKDNNLRCIDLGGRFGAQPGYETVDRLDADVICDLNGTWNFEDNSVGVIRASHIFEHLKNPIHTMNEAFRVLAGGGWLFIDVPSTDGRGAWCDPTHVSFWNETSFRYYTNKQFAAYISPEYIGKFQLSRKCTWVPPEFKHENIPIVQADLICLKPPYSDRPPGEMFF